MIVEFFIDLCPTINHLKAQAETRRLKSQSHDFLCTINYSKTFSNLTLNLTLKNVNHLCRFREIASCNDLLQSLLKFGDCLIKNHGTSVDSCLFSDIGNYENSVKTTIDTIDKKSFFGRVFGFQVSLQF